MANLVIVLGDPGSGKTMSMFFPESQTPFDNTNNFHIDADGNEFPSEDAYQYYSELSQENPEGNYLVPKNAAMVLNLLRHVNKNKRFKTCTIDTISNLCVDEFMSRAGETGYTKFTQLGLDIHLILTYIRKEMRSDLTVYVFGHVEEYYKSDGVVAMRLKTPSKLIREKITPESKAKAVFMTTRDSEGNYCFLTKDIEGAPCRAPYGMFEDYIPADLGFVQSKISKSSFKFSKN